MVALHTITGGIEEDGVVGTTVKVEVKDWSVLTRSSISFVRTSVLESSGVVEVLARRPRSK